MLRLVKILTLIFIIAYFSACSSSSHNSRYNEQEEKDTRNNDSGSARFTSTDDYRKIYNEEFDEEPIEDIDVNLDDLPIRYSDASSIDLTTDDKLVMEVIKYVNTPYQFGGTGHKGIDCSAFTQNVFNEALDFSLPRTAALQFKKGTKIKSKKNLRIGDLVFFNTRRAAYPGHVGIYLGEGLFAHASVSKGVTVSSLESSYYKKRFISGRRVIN